MDWNAVVLKAVGSPWLYLFVLCIIVFCFYGRRLMQLISRIRTVKGKDWEAQLDALGDDLKTGAIVGTGGIDKPINGLRIHMSYDLLVMATISPRRAVNEAWDRMLLEISSIATQVGLPPQGDFAATVKALSEHPKLLAAQGNPKAFIVLFEFLREVRNKLVELGSAYDDGRLPLKEQQRLVTTSASIISFFALQLAKIRMDLGLELFSSTSVDLNKEVASITEALQEAKAS